MLNQLNPNESPRLPRLRKLTGRKEPPSNRLADQGATIEGVVQPGAPLGTQRDLFTCAGPWHGYLPTKCGYSLSCHVPSGCDCPVDSSLAPRNGKFFAFVVAALIHSHNSHLGFFKLILAKVCPWPDSYQFHVQPLQIRQVEPSNKHGFHTWTCWSPDWFSMVFTHFSRVLSDKSVRSTTGGIPKPVWFIQCKAPVR